MALTIANGPLSPKPAGEMNFTRQGPAHALYFEDAPRRVRAKFAGETIADSRRTKLLHETGLFPTYYFPLDDIDRDRLVATDHTTHCPFKGDARYWSVRVGDKVADNAVWTYPEPVDTAPPIKGYAALYWDKMDAWYEEDERLIGHVRDPYHRIDCLASSRHVRVSVGGQVIAESRRPVLVFETGLSTRFYLPRDDVRLDSLAASETRTVCPYKGETTGYWSHGSGDARVEDLAWAYDDPRPEAGPLAGLVGFYNERVDLQVDGEPFE